MVERSGRKESENKLNVLDFMITSQSVMECSRFSRKYEIKERLDEKQKEIFDNYFMAYRLLRDDANKGVLDFATDVETEMSRKLPLVGGLARLVERIAESIREASSKYRQEGDELAEDYLESITEDSPKIMPSKLLRVANMANHFMVQERPPSEIENILNEYLDRELPKIK